MVDDFRSPGVVFLCFLRRVQLALQIAKVLEGPQEPLILRSIFLLFDLKLLLIVLHGL